MELEDSSLIESYVAEQLHRLKNRRPNNPTFKRIEEFIVHALTRVAYKSHSISSSYTVHIENVVSHAVKASQPIQIVCPYGGYKLWKLPQSPYAEWAELFFLMHKVNWLKPILEIYPPGIHFDFFSDGPIIPFLNGIPEEHITQYDESFKQVVQRLTPYLPDGISFTFHSILDLYPSLEVIMFELEENYKDLLILDRFEPLKFSEQEEKSARANVYTDTEISEKALHTLLLRHEAYATCANRRPYYRAPDKIFAGFTPVHEALPLKSTRTSSMRFWLGTGYVTPYVHEDKYIEGIMSPLGRSKATIKKIPVSIEGFSDLKNFDTIDYVDAAQYENEGAHQ